MLAMSKVAERMFGEVEILVPAKDLFAMEGIDIMQNRSSIICCHVHFESHKILFAEGWLTESAYIGRPAFRSTDLAALDDLGQNFGDLPDRRERYDAAAAWMSVQSKKRVCWRPDTQRTTSRFRHRVAGRR